MNQPARAPWRIDVHNHVLPPQYVATTPLPMQVPSLEQQLENMDQLGIAASLTSLTPRVLDAHPDQLAAVTRACNEFQADLITRHPQRFGAFAVLPLPDVDAALDELAYALDVLHLDGVGLFSSSQGRYLGDPLFDPVFDELQRRKATVFVHPAHASAPAECHLGAPGGVIEYGIDTTRAIVNLLWQETFKARQDVKIIFSHAGGAAPFFTHRISGLKGPDRRAEVVEAMRFFYYDVASAMGPYALASLQELADPTHVVWGSDMPFVSPRAVAHEIEGWQAYARLDDPGRLAIERDNALRLFPRLDRVTVN